MFESLIALFYFYNWKWMVLYSSNEFYIWIEYFASILSFINLHGWDVKTVKDVLPSAHFYEISRKKFYPY